MSISMLRNKQILLIYLLLPVAVLIAFWQVNQCDFINYDDPAYVTENVHIRHGITLEAVRWAFTAGYAANWHPLTWMSHMLDVQLFGLNPHGHHLTNLLFHIANTLLLFLVFNRMTKAPWKSAFVAALFAFHPLHVESVAWVSERKDVLSTFFWMLTIGAYIHYVEHRTDDGKQRTEGSRLVSSVIRHPSSVFSYSPVLIFFIFGLMAKPMLVTLPFVLLLLDYWPLRRLQEREQGSLKPVAQCKLQAGRKNRSLRIKENRVKNLPISEMRLTRSPLLSPQSSVARTTRSNSTTGLPSAGPEVLSPSPCALCSWKKSPFLPWQRSHVS